MANFVPALESDREKHHFYSELLSLEEEEKLDYSVNAAYVKSEEDDENSDDVFDLTPKNQFNSLSKTLTILDRLIKCHPIWYLPHVGRTAANHILMSQKPGIFVVRHSSHSNSRALSVRLSNLNNKNYEVDVEHYLIEISPSTTNNNGKIRLHGSEKSFSALPFLIEHYFNDEKCLELPVKLRLPDKIMNCRSNRELCSLSLLGQDFWSSFQTKAHRSFSLSIYPQPPTPKNNFLDGAKRSCSVKFGEKLFGKSKSSIWYRNLAEEKKSIYKKSHLFFKEPNKYVLQQEQFCDEKLEKNKILQKEQNLTLNLSSFKPKSNNNLEKFTNLLRSNKLLERKNSTTRRLSAPNLLEWMKKLKTNNQLATIKENLNLKAKSAENILSINNQYYSNDYGMITDFHKKIDKSIDDDQISNCGTLFSEPWDSTSWQTLICQKQQQPIAKLVDFPIAVWASQRTLEKKPKRPPGMLLGERRNSKHSVEDVAYSAGNMAAWALGTLPKRQENKGDDGKFALGPVLSPARFREPLYKHRHSADPSSKIQTCVENLSTDLRSFFAVQIKNFIDCTLQAREEDPQIVIGNVRQFMNGIKNYLVKQGESDLHTIIERERSKLRPDEFLNIDAIFEGVLEKIILQKLKPHLYRILVQNASKNGSLNILSSNFSVLRSKTCQELGIMILKEVDPIIEDKIRNFLRKMQNQYSPLKKLENLLEALSTAYQTSLSPSSKCRRLSFLPSGDTLLNWLVYLLSRYSVVGCEIESIYMRGLLHPSLLSGEACFYLTAFSSAVHVLKHLDLLPKKSLIDQQFCQAYSLDSPNSECVLKVAIPNEIHGTISYQSFPLAPQLTVQKFCKMIAHKCCVTNPEDYGLYLLVDGFETCLLQNESPYLINEQLQMAGAARMFVYKRHEAKIAWPKSCMSP